MVGWEPNVHVYRSLTGLMLLALVFSSTSEAVVLRPVSASELQARATHISLSTVEKVESFWQAGRILSWIELSVHTAYRGSADRVRILVPGGTVGHLTQWVPGGPRFEIGERSLYFLEPMSNQDGYRLVGFTQGQIRENRASHSVFQKWVVRLSKAFINTENSTRELRP